jgi:hypothetical protein
VDGGGPDGHGLAATACRRLHESNRPVYGVRTTFVDCTDEILRKTMCSFPNSAGIIIINISCSSNTMQQQQQQQYGSRSLGGALATCEVKYEGVDEAGVTFRTSLLGCGVQLDFCTSAPHVCGAQLARRLRQYPSLTYWTRGMTSLNQNCQRCFIARVPSHSSRDSRKFLNKCGIYLFTQKRRE